MRRTPHVRRTEPMIMDGPADDVGSLTVILYNIKIYHVWSLIQ